MLKGNVVGLVAIERGDLKQLMDWRNNCNFRKHFREYRELNMVMQERWFEQRVLNDPTAIMFSIKRFGDNELVGCCGLVHINWVHRHAEISLYIGWNDAYIDEIGYAEESCKLCFNYGFYELGLNKIWTEIYEFDEKKEKLYDKFYFHQDGLLRRNYYYGGKWWDSRILSLLKEDYDKHFSSEKDSYEFDW
jgi:RimJ/RimL family protein N-acetyltransferase